MVQAQIPVDDEAFDLMELSQMSVIKRLVPEDPIDREKLPWPERLLLSDLLQVPRRDSSCVSPEDVLERFLRLPLVIIAAASVSSFLVHFLHLLEIFLVLNCRLLRVRDEEGVVGVTGRMRLRLEERIEVPEGAFHISVGVHLFKAHLEEDFYELLACLHEEMQVSVLDLETLGGWVEFLELRLLPGLVQEHGAGQLRHQLDLLFPIFFSLGDHKGGLLLLLNQLPSLQVLDVLLGDGFALALGD